jgi:hypothetical protein
VHSGGNEDEGFMHFAEMFFISVGEERFLVLLRRILPGIAAGDADEVDGSFLIGKEIRSVELISTYLLKYTSSR